MYLIVEAVEQGHEFGWQSSMVGLFKVNEFNIVVMICIFLFLHSLLCTGTR